MRSTILVPIIGYFIVFNEALAQFLKLIPAIEPRDIHPSANLMLTYFGLVFLSVGTAIYIVFCHHRVKYYGSAAAYIGGDGPHITDSECEQLAERLGCSLFNPNVDPDLPDAVREEFKENRRRERRELLGYAFRDWDQRYPLARVFAAIAYALGFIVLLIPSVHVFYKVAIIFVGRLAGLV